ncbi:MAG: tRNA (N6-threonylcarbamoyladenosine(37)-N6)-methyltransferase TrmO [Deltaproteobacteria bacterium RIFCSPLOWO2_12_FULL_60_19]|nr:MAG: tRNA (N6-threonylcarbamoyladenosine(37)-N6)-methyltransferase TrmO [Deltaproteobacteria bacterium RIFCSPLOWO2_12_FULL_60_19]
MVINLRPVGIVKTAAGDDEVKEKGSVEGELEIYPEFAEALDGIDGYSHLFVIVYFDRLRPEQIGPLQVKPRGLLKKGFKPEELPLLGVFALDSPTRPNPIGLSLVRLTKREGCALSVTGLDFFNGTPILDIKGYRPQYRADDYSLPGWYRRFADEKGHI